jgi:hypothetical protein
MSAETEYPHRRNRDGTWDSICTKCFLTVARCKTESDLAEFEKAHICNSAFLADRGHFSISTHPSWDGTVSYRESRAEEPQRKSA